MVEYINENFNHFTMRKLKALTLAMVISVCRLPFLVQAFLPQQRPVHRHVSAMRFYLKIKEENPLTFRDESIYQCSSCTTEKKNIESLSSRLFTSRSLDDNTKREQGPRRLFGAVLSLFRRAKMMSRRLRTWILPIFLIFAIHCLVPDPALAAGANGRIGGSYGRSNRYAEHTINRHSSSVDRKIQNNHQHRPAAPIRVMYAPRLRTNSHRGYPNFHQPDGEKVAGERSIVVTNPDGSMNVVRKHNTHPFSDSKYSASNVVLATGVTAVVVRGVTNRKRYSDREKYLDDDPSRHALGPGVSVWSLTACLNVPDNNDPRSIMHRLQRLAESTSTENREGLQYLLAETSLELSRQVDKSTIVSVESRYDHYRSTDQALVRAERQYNRISTRERSKFDRESWGSYNGRIVSDDLKKESLDTTNGNATLALVQIHLVIEGNSMKDFGQRQVETRNSLKEALVQLSGDVNTITDCVVAGEVLWAPQQEQEVITEKDIYANYPTLWQVEY